MALCPSRRGGAGAGLTSVHIDTSFSHAPGSVPLANLVACTLKIHSPGLEETFAHLCSQQHFHNGQKAEATRVSISGGWINKMWSIHAVEYYSASKRKATMWMNLEDIIPSRISQLQKDKCCQIPLIGGPWRISVSVHLATPGAS